MPTIADVFALAHQYHQSGHYSQAEQLCRQIIQAAPSHAESYHLLGVLACLRGRYDQGETWIRQALRLRPESAEVHFDLGNVLQGQGKLEEAVTHWQQVLRLRPGFAPAHNNLGNALKQLGRLEEAANHCQEALRLEPDFPEAHLNLGNVLFDQEMIDQAVVCYQRATDLNPKFSVAHNNLGNARARQGRFDEAVRCFQKAIELQPDFATAYNNLGIAYQHQGRLEEAVDCFGKASQLDSGDELVRYNQGLALTELGRLQEAVASHQQALQLKPDFAEAHNGLGVALAKQGQFDQALACFERALGYDASHAESHVNRAQVRLLHGQWEQAWPDYEWRLHFKDVPRWSLAQPRWDGSPLAGRKLLLLAEQGLGDTLQFFRYVPLLEKQGGHVILQCQPSLERLLAHNLGKANLAPQELAGVEFDVYSPLLSLPGILGTTPANIPGAVPYLKADEELVRHWGRELASLQGLKVGIFWRGSPTLSGDRQRSIPLACFAPLAEAPGVQLVSLQKGVGVEQLAEWTGKHNVPDLGSRLEDFMDTAAVLLNLDLLITCDTAVAHLAGALGVAVWVALPQIPDWRWLLEREDSPWYSSMRLFRQTRFGCWEDVFERIGRELRSHEEKANMPGIY